MSRTSEWVNRSRETLHCGRSTELMTTFNHIPIVSK